MLTQKIQLSKNKISLLFLILPLVLMILTAVVNNGFMASDEYWTGISRYIPAQKADLQSLIREDDVKSHLQLMPFYFMSQVSLKLGIEHPYLQYRFTGISLAILNSLILLLAFYLFVSKNRFHFLLLGLFYPSTFLFTRPMFESMAAPWLTLAIVLAHRYDLFEKRKDLFWAAVSLSLAFCLRPQVGIVGLVLLFLPILKKKWKDLFYVTLIGTFCFTLAGLPDLYLRGQFHRSFLAVTFYNFKEGHVYGEDPWYYYLLLIPIICLTPFWGWFVSRTECLASFLKQRTLWISLVLFVFLHSLFSQKFERFTIPIIPTLIILMSGFLLPIFQKLKTKTSLKLKLFISLLLIFNFLLFVPAAFWPSQQNIINLALFLDEHPQFTEIHNINESYTWMPELFINSQSRAKLIEHRPSELNPSLSSNCDALIALNLANKIQYSKILETFQLLKILDVNPIEALALKLNPEHNRRRSPIYLYGCKK